MKTNNSKKSGRPHKQTAGSLAARAAEADKQAETARHLARLAKSKFKEARKAYKQAKKFAKQARKQAKAAAKALKQRARQSRKPVKRKREPAPAAAKMHSRRGVVPPAARPPASPKPPGPGANLRIEMAPPPGENGHDVSQG